MFYGLAVLALVVFGRPGQAAEIARFAPDCIVLFRELARSDAISRSSKIVVVLTLAYLLMPIDLVPDFIPVAGYLDDALVVALALRFILRRVDVEAIIGCWRGTPSGLRAVMRVAGASTER